MEDVSEERKEALKNAIPDNVKKAVDADTINQLIQTAVDKPKQMTPDDYARHIYIDNLPSKYLKYPEGTKIYGRPMSLRELKKLSTITTNNASSVIDDVLRSTIKGIAFDDILLGDKLYLIFWLRANTYTESGFSVPFVCTECENETSYDFKVDNIGVNPIREDAVYEEPLELPNKDFIVFKYPTLKDEQRISRFKEAVRKSMTKYDDDTLTLAVNIDTINGKPLPLLDVYNYISDAKVYSQVKGYVNDFDFGINSVLTVKCNSCGGTAQAGLTFREDFFIPPYRFAKSARNGVQDK